MRGSEQRTNDWYIQEYEPTSVESLAGFVRITFAEPEPPIMQFRTGQLWKSACIVRVYDDGRVRVTAERHLTQRQRHTVAGIAEHCWHGGPDRCKREPGWRRARRSQKRPIGSYVSSFWVVVDQHEPGYAEARADQALVARDGAINAHFAPSTKADMAGPRLLPPAVGA